MQTVEKSQQSNILFIHRRFFDKWSKSHRIGIGQLLQVFIYKRLQKRSLVRKLPRKIHISSIILFIRKEFTLHEIKKATFDLPKEKAPSPDGFSLLFFQEGWDTINDDILSCFTVFHSNKKKIRGLNVTFLTLIPKKTGASAITDFCHISLISAPYKILAKALSNHILLVIHDTIDGNQFPFVKDRNTMDCTSVTNESVEDYHRTKKRGTIIKLDLEKAYTIQIGNF